MGFPPPSRLESPVDGRDAPLQDVLANRRWLLRAEPFPHIVASHVLQGRIYHAIERQFDEILARGFRPRRGWQFSRGIPGYDAYGLNLGPRLGGPLSLFTSRAWHDMLATVLRIDVTGDVNCGLHHHATGSRSGRVHNDLNPGWFAGEPGLGSIRLARPDVCDYCSGAPRASGVAPRATIRAAAMLFYLRNEPWVPGDGGETGLYGTARSRVDEPSATVAPRDNSLLLFECTPHSFHTFLSNPARPRNSVIMWLHRPWTDVARRWGEGAIVDWPAVPRSQNS